MRFKTLKTLYLVKCLGVTLLLHLHENTAYQRSQLEGVRLDLIQVTSILRTGGSVLLHQTQALQSVSIRDVLL